MKWGILATGTIARKFAQTINQMDGETLVAVGSRRADSARTFADQFAIPRAHDSYEALAADPEVECVYIATPNALHYENCKLCLEHGKHVLCEKPFTIDPAQAESLYRLAEGKRLFIMEALWTRMLPLYTELRRRIREGEIGQLRHVACQYGFVAQGARKDRKFNSALGGGALLDIGIYNLGFLQLVTGAEPTEVATAELTINDYGTDAYSKLILSYPGGITAESIQTIGQELERRAVIEGTAGTIVLPDFQCAEEMTVNGETVRMPFEINGFEYEVRAFSRRVREGVAPAYTPADSVALMRLLYDIRTSWNMAFEGEQTMTHAPDGNAGAIRT